MLVRPLIAAVTQSGAALAALAAMALWPPRRGPMLILPMGGGAGEVVDAALTGDALILGRGPVDGSLVVLGDRARVAGAVGRRPMLLLAAPAALCGRVVEGVDA